MSTSQKSNRKKANLGNNFGNISNSTPDHATQGLEGQKKIESLGVEKTTQKWQGIAKQLRRHFS